MSSTEVNGPQVSQLDLWIILLLAEDYSYKEIAHELAYSPISIRHRVATLIRRFDVYTRQGVVTYALKQGLITLDDINLRRKVF